MVRQLLEEIDNPSVLVDYLVISIFLALATLPAIWVALEGGNYLVMLALNFPIMFAISLFMIWKVIVGRPRRIRVFEDGVELVFANSKKRRFVPWNEILDIQLESYDSTSTSSRQLKAGTIVTKKDIEYPFADQELPYRKVDTYPVALGAAVRMVKYRPDKLNTGFMRDLINKTGKD
jgi:hypothetical protein